MEHSVDHELLLRTKDSIKVHSGLPRSSDLGFSQCSSVSLFSPSGTYQAYVSAGGLFVRSASGERQLVSRDSIQYLAFSPCEEFLVTWEKHMPGSPNLIIWDISTLSQAYRFTYKKNPHDSWPLVLFGGSLCYIQQGTEVHAFNPRVHQPPSCLQTVPVTTFSVKGELMLTFTIGNPGHLSLYSLKEGKSLISADIDKPDVTECSFLWSPSGKQAIAWCQSDVDRTGRSYYGEHALYSVSIQDGFQGVETSDGPIYDVQWSPVTDEFITVSGFMPANVALHSNGQNTPIGKAHRNHVRWNAFADLVLVGGFGNLLGDIDVYERSSLKPVGYCRAALTVACEWAPCGRVFIAATLSPRLRVDNGYKIYKYNGDLLLSVPAPDELWQVQWRPKACTFTPIVTASPLKQNKRPAYRPPGSTSDFAEKFRARNLDPQVPKDFLSQTFEGTDSAKIQAKKKKKRKNKNEELYSHR